ncbi:MAG: cation transporter [Candidatus Marinimicrobia bacterium]|nr:cation transporter [Candidatus Neomarinimicrobiota bacterium]
MSIFESITNKYIPVNKDPVRVYRSRIGKFQGWVSVAINTLLFAIKLVIGLMVNSVAMMADAIHTFSDVISSSVVIWGFNEAEKPADKEHPYGHGRAEYIAALIIAVLLFVAGIEFIESSIDAIRNPEPINPEWWMIIVVFLTIFLKEFTARYAEFLSTKIASGALHADAWHHRIDAISSVLVVVALILGKFGITGVDGWAGLGVSAFIIWTGIEIAKDSVDDLLGKPPSDEEIEDIRLQTMKVDGVLGAHDIAIHSYGKDRFVSIHIEIDSKNSPSNAHDIAEAVEERLHDYLDVAPTVHVDPVKLSHPKVKEVREYLETYWSNDERITGFHDVRIVDTDNHQVILFGINIDPELSRSMSVKCCKDLEQATSDQFPGYEINVKISGKHLF